MKSNLVVLYVPGVGDTSITGQRFAVGIWRLWGVQPEVLQMHWSSRETWQDKESRLLARVDELIATGRQVALVGASAGAAAVMNVYAQRVTRLAGCILLAGKINHPETIGENYRRLNPALLACAEACEQSLKSLQGADRMHIWSRYALFDQIVPWRDSFIAGAHNQRVFTVGHAFTIGFELLCGAPVFLRHLRRQAK